MSTPEFQRQLLESLSRLEVGLRGDIGRLNDELVRLNEGQTQVRTELVGMRADIVEIRSEIAGMREEMAEMRGADEDMRSDIRTLTRVIVRRFGTAGSPSPQVGDHVLYHLGMDTLHPAVVVNVNGDRLDLEVFGEVPEPHRFPRQVPPGDGPGCWRHPQ